MGRRTHAPYTWGEPRNHKIKRRDVVIAISKEEFTDRLANLGRQLRGLCKEYDTNYTSIVLASGVIIGNTYLKSEGYVSIYITDDKEGRYQNVR